MGVRSAEIVGVVADSHDTAFDELPQPTVFLKLQDPRTGMRVHFSLRAHTRDLPPGTIQRAVATADAEAILLEDSTIQERLMRSIQDRTFATLTLVFFAIAALGICVAGLAGIVVHTVARRTREIAVRMALGASAAVVRRLVVREAVMAAASGCALGVAAALSVSRLLQHLLYGVEARDPLSLALAACLCLGVTGLAAWIPARRATRLSPASALRAE
jgi:predicted lysophospholipase L1 biosynthesis ABC-type transport system permease subunit